MALPERSDALVGSMLGKDYRVLQPIGSGGMAVVYLVEHQTLLKRFAAKVLSNELASSMEARARFTQEAHAASQLDHENIVTISDFGVTADQRPFFVMELLRGQTLDQRLGDGPMTIEEVVAVAVPVARALAHAHAESIVHRDIKPENIFLVQRSQGRWGVKVVDFGIAKTPVNPKLTKMGETLGSPLFMAPEMIRGEDDVDQRCDVYSFGVLLYLMLCGRLPFFDENLLKVMQMHLSTPVPPPQAINPGLPAQLASVVQRALAKRADDRYPSMDALLLDLEAALPAGSDRLLIEAQSGTARGDTPFASTLSVSRHESQRTLRVAPLPAPPGGEVALRTMRVSPLRASPADPRPDQVRSAAPRRIAIVIASALVTGLLGVIGWLQLAGRPGKRATPVAVLSPDSTPGVPVAEPAASEPAAAAQPAPPRVAADSAPVATAADPDGDPAADDDSAPEAEPSRLERTVSGGRRQPGRSKPPIRREPARSAKRVAQVTPAIAAGRGAGPAPQPAETEPAGPAAPAAVVPATERDTSPPPTAAPSPPPVPAPPLAPAPAPVVPAAPPSPGSLDADPEVTTIDVKGSLPPSVVRRSVERALPSLRSCYQAAARANKTTPAIDLQLTFEIDENSMAIHVTTSGTRFGSLASCAAGVIRQLHTPQAPDIGTAPVSVHIRFRPS